MMRSLLLAFLGACLLAVTASATQVIHKSVQQLGSESVAVVRGQVTDIHSFWNDSHTKIFTEVTVAVAETYKGAAAPTVRVLQLGGVVDNVKVTVHGALQWRLDEEVLMFLEPYRQGAYHVSGFSQGKFQIEHDKQTGKPFVRRLVQDGPELVGSTSADVRDWSRTTPLDEFVDYALGRKGGAR